MLRRLDMDDGGSVSDLSTGGLKRPSATSTLRAKRFEILWPDRATTLTVISLTLALWFAVAIVFVAAVVSDPEQLPRTMLGHGLTAVGGAILCTPLYLASVSLSGVELARRVVLLALGVLTISCLQGWIDLSIYTAVMRRYVPAAKLPDPVLTWRFNVMIYIWIYAFYTTTIAMVLGMLKAQKSERQLLQARAAADRARLDALRLQINPHFLFNALNAATSLVSLGRNSEAETVLLRLSDFFRGSLANHADDMVPLATEFDDLSAYLDIEAIRFGARLKVVMDMPDALRAVPVPHFVLQPLVENAVKHGVAKSTGRTTISVVATSDGERISVRIENDEVPDLASRPAGTGVGLLNVKDRLQVIYGDRAVLATGRSSGRFWSQIDLPRA